MDLNLASKVALITGASAGIGRAIAQQLAAEGVSVVLNGRNADALRAVEQELGTERALAVPGDIRSLDDIGRVVSEADRRFGKIDILVNNAGSTPAGKIETLTDDEWRMSLELKFLGYVRCAREVLPQMQRRRWGRIINIIGGAGYQPRPTYIAGGMINAAIVNFTKGLSHDVAPSNVLVNGISPGPIRTERWLGIVAQRSELEGVSEEEIEAQTAKALPVRRIGLPQDIAGLTAFLCSDHASFITGAVFDVDGGGRVGI